MTDAPAQSPVVVPREPTLEMQKAYFDVIDRNMSRVQTDPRFGRFENHKAAYAAMLASRPAQPPSKAAELAAHLEQAARDLHPYSLGEIDSPCLNVALPAYLNEAARILSMLPGEDRGGPTYKACEVCGAREGYGFRCPRCAETLPAALTSVGDGSLPPAAPSSVPSGDVDGGAGQ